MADPAALAASRATVLDWRFKGVPPAVDGCALSELGALGLNAFSGDLLLPAMVLRRSAVEHNVELMRGYCEAKGVSLAPHAKTHMSPQLLALQSDAGAWAFSVATTSQARTLQAFGVKRLIIASQVVEPEAVKWLAAQLAGDDDLEVLCLVDDAAAATWLSASFGALRPERPLQILVELGHEGGRTGARGVEEAVAIAAHVADSDHLELAGIEGYEGMLVDTDVGTDVDGYLTSIRAVVEQTATRGLYPGRDEVIVSAGGSAAFDRVVEHLSQWDLDIPVRTVLRSGCYLTHDVGMYDATSPFGSVRAGDGPRLRPALALVAAVWSRPEPSLALVGAGRRDVSYDAGLPVVESVMTAESSRDVRGRFTVTELNDQHAYVEVPYDDDLRAGDIVTMGISHPCTAFERWPLIFVVEDDGTIVDGVLTYF